MSVEQSRLEAQYEEGMKELKDVAVESVSEALPEVEAPSEVVFTELEQEQMDKGWDPKHPDGVSAKEFKRVGEIIEAKRKASKEAQVKGREVDELTKTVKQLVEHNKAMAKAAYEQKQKELSFKKMEKIQEGDVDAVFQIEAEQAALKPVIADEPVVQQQQAPEPSAEIKAFQDKYKDYLTGTSAEARRVQSLVKGQVEFYMANNPDISDSVAIAEIEDMLGKVYPDKFGAEPKSKVSKVGSSSVSSKKDSSVSMSTEDRILFESIKAVDSKFTIDDFSSMYLKNRK